MLMRPKQRVEGSGAAGARPLSRHYTTLCIFPSGVRWPGVSGGQNFPWEFPIYTPPCPFICPGHLINFPPYAPIFCPPVPPI